MRFITFVVVVGLGVFAYQNKHRFITPKAPALEFSDLQGKSRSLANPEKPVLMGFWIADCGYCENMLGILNSVSKKHAAGDIEVIAFFLNDVPESTISEAAAAEGFWGTVVKTQQRREMIAAYDKAFKIRGPGRDAYVVDKSGAFHTVSLVDDKDDFIPQGEIEAKLEELIAKAGD